ncbi:hypothetical protein K3G63_07595 [Hymenobacter sp. HSC-4F20]|uniref:hypothetical protein n=1 Tax=Hymenobacter sp. HSC-4F20 TaxID=2864135 RepID=UPI001C73DA1F|nr:hypothetical protein [Hymenobacter sp. HSC-4F20]MBX0290297.1 hypothetical protein [Hymenobacter sp. HSC-4F20]
MKVFHLSGSILFAFFFLSSFVSDKWIRYPIDTQLSVQLPGTPETREINTKEVDFEQHIRAFTLQDGSGQYTIIRDDMTHESDNYLTPVGRREYYQAAPIGWLSTEKGELLKQSKFSVSGVEGIELTYKVPVADKSQVHIKYVRMLLVGKIAYAFHFTPSNVKSQKNKEPRNTFFESISLESEKEAKQ